MVVTVGGDGDGDGESWWVDILCWKNIQQTQNFK